MADHIKINGLSLIAPVSVSPWPTIDPPEKPVLQPIVVSLDILHDIIAAGTSDDLTQSVNYSEVSKIAQKVCSDSQPSYNSGGITALGLSDRILEQCLAGISLPIAELSVNLDLPKAVLRAKSAFVHISRKRDGSLSGKVKFGIKDLLVHTVVGINPQEREDKQPVLVNIDLACNKELSRDTHLPFAKLERTLSTVSGMSYVWIITSEAHGKT